MKTYNLSIKLEDFREAQRLHLKVHSMPKKAFVFSSLVYLGVFCALLYNLLINNDYNNLLTIMIILPLAGFIYYKRLLPAQWKKAYEASPFLQEAYEMSYDDEFYMAKAPSGTLKIAWSKFLKWESNENIILLYQSAKSMNIIPLKNFGSEQEIADLRQVLNNRIGLPLKK